MSEINESAKQIVATAHDYAKAEDVTAITEIVAWMERSGIRGPHHLRNRPWSTPMVQWVAMGCGLTASPILWRATQ